MGKPPTITLALAFALLATACGTPVDRAESLPLKLEIGLAAHSSWPAFPPPDFAQPRRPSVSGTFSTDGRYPFQRGPETVVGQTGLLIYPFETGGWAVYCFPGLYPTERVKALTIRLGSGVVPLPTQLHVGISNYFATRWEWYTLHAPTADFTFSLPVTTDHESPQGNMYIAVVPTAEAVEVSSLAAHLHYTAPPPVDLRAGDGTSQAGIELTWTDPDFTYSDEPDFEYAGVGIQRATSPEGPWSTIVSVARGKTEFLDTLAAQFPPGQRLYYRLQTIRGDFGPPGIADVGYVDFAPLAVRVNPKHQYAPAYVVLDGSNSIDPDGGLLTYEWDFEGSGNWESSGNNPFGAHTYYNSNSGQVTARMRVIDDEGNVSEPKSFSFTLYGQAKFAPAVYVDGERMKYVQLDSPDGSTYLIVRQDDGKDILCRVDAELNVGWAFKWSARLNFLGVDSGGQYVYLTSHLSPDPDNCIVCFNSDGEPQWAKTSELSSYTEFGLVGKDDRLYLGSSLFMAGQVLTCLIPDGTAAWDYQVENGAITAMISDEEANLVATGFTDGKPLAIKLTTEADILWQKRINTWNSEEWGIKVVEASNLDRYIVATGSETTSSLIELTKDGAIYGQKLITSQFRQLRYHTGRFYWSDYRGLLSCAMGSSPVLHWQHSAISLFDLDGVDSAGMHLSGFFNPFGQWTSVGGPASQPTDYTVSDSDVELVATGADWVSCSYPAPEPVEVEVLPGSVEDVICLLPRLETWSQ